MSALATSPWKIAEVSLGRTVHKISELLIYESELLDGYEKDFRFTENVFRRMHLMLKNVEASAGRGLDNDPALKTLVEDMKSLAFQVEAVVDAFVLRKRGRRGWRDLIDAFFLVFMNQTPRVKLINDLERIRSLIFPLLNRASTLGLKPIEARRDFSPAIQNLEPQGRLLSPDEIEKGEAVSLEEDVHILVSWLTGGKASSGVISIVGARGIGKTTLALKVYKKAAIDNHFHCRAWVTLPQDYELNEFLQIIAKQLPLGLEYVEREWSTEELREKINFFLRHKRYLIVLDNVRTPKDWDDLQGVFPSTSWASRILITTRDREVALLTEPDTGLCSIYDMWALSEERSWELFIAKVLVPAELEPRGREIVRKCMGLPLAISAAAEFLSSKPATEEQWLTASKQIDQDQSLYCTLNLTADALPSNLNLCLSYLGLFPKDDYISVRRLIELWVAEGLVQQKRGHRKPPEYVAEKYLRALENKNMIQVGKRKPDGKIKNCRMQPLLRDDWVPRAKEARLVQSPVEATSSKTFAIPGMIRRLADHLDVKDDCFSHIHGDASHSLRSYYGDLRSFLSFDSREGPAPGEEIGNFLRRGISGKYFKRLRVIDLEGVFRPKLTEEIGKLIELRYLGLRWTYLEILPSSIGNLLNLQTLDLKHTYISTLPSSIWKMMRLRHLYLSDSYRCRFVSPPNASSLTDLQTFCGVFLDEGSPVKGGLDRLVNLRKVGLVCRLTFPQQKALARWLSRLSHLESLRLRSIDESVHPSKLYLGNFSGLKNLSTLYLFGRLGNPAAVRYFPESLTEITLSVSGLTEDPMPMLEKLPNLRILRLLSCSYMGKTMVCSKGGFPLLRVLKLWKLEELEEWMVEEGALAIVKEIEIRSCGKLKMIPDGMLHLVHCRELKLKSMPEEFNARVIGNTGQDWYKIAHVPSVCVES